MSEQLIDLDLLITTIRDTRSRTYFLDALRCYRAGALRSAISATWVAVAYDLIQKYRELASLDDREAVRFIADWDRAIANSNTARLLELERGLPDHAHSQMVLIDEAGLRSLKRLLEDRHSCAHPAFTTQDTLYDPSNELVRTHLVAAIELILSQGPVQGRSLFEEFGRDVVSPGFPSARDTVINYVEQKYIERLRPAIIRNFGIVLAKSLVRNVPPEWQRVLHKVAYSLECIQDRRPEIWPEVDTELCRLINEAEPDDRVRALATIAYFPHVMQRLTEPTKTAIRETIENIGQEPVEGHIFAAADIPEFAQQAIASFERLNDEQAAEVLTVFSPLGLWSSALERYGASGSYRAAEARFEQFIAPYRSTMNEERWDGLLERVAENGQIWNAAQTPDQLTSLLEGSPNVRPSDHAANTFFQSLRRRGFEQFFEILEERGWNRPAQDDDDDDQE